MRFRPEKARTKNDIRSAIDDRPQQLRVFARLGVRIYEVAVSYHGRTYADGKKITWRDGMHALVCIFKYNFLAR